MTHPERILYHQVHPLKVAVDLVSGLWALRLLWQGHTVAGICIAVLPPTAASLALLAGADLDGLRRSALGRYARRSLGPVAQCCRFAAAAGAALAAAGHRPLLLALALLVLAVVLLRGAVLPWRNAGMHPRR